MRLAYLCNRYPAVSHSFVRREIDGVEAAGHEVHRFSVRPPNDDLKDEADIRERPRTAVVLDQGISRLSISALMLLLTRPLKSLAALRTAMQLSAPGLHSKARHIAYWLEAGWLLRNLERLKVQHLHAHFGTNPAAVAAIVRAWGGPPFSFTVHGPDEFDAPIALSLRRKIHAASFVAGVSSYGSSQLMRWSALCDWPKIKVVRCGVSSDFTDAEVQPIEPSSTHFLCVARLSGQKGLPLLIAACDQLHRGGEKFTLTIIGDGELRGELEAEIRRRNLAGVVELAGSRSAAEIREALAGARAFVLPSFAEGLPVVLMEALAMGRPVIATSIAGIPELVDDRCGWLIPAGAEEALVEAMRNALQTPADALSAKGIVGRERVLRMHDARNNGAALAQFFGAAVISPPGAHA